MRQRKKLTDSKTIPILTAVLFAAGLVSCPGREAAPPGTLRVVASIFVLYDFAREIGGPDASVSLFLPPGAEAHTYEPAARDIIGLRSARIFLYTGGLMESWADRVLTAAAGPELLAVDVTRGMTLLEATGEGHDHGEEAGGHHGVDPHFWLDPMRCLTALDAIADAFTRADPTRAAAYAGRAARLREKLVALDREIREGLERRAQSTIVFGGHNVFGYFGARYGLQFISPYPGFSPEAEPQAKKLVELAALMRERKLKVIYHEESVDPKAARALAGSTGARLVLLHGAHNVTRAEMEAGATYLSLMRANLAKLKADPGLFPALP